MKFLAALPVFPAAALNLVVVADLVRVPALAVLAPGVLGGGKDFVKPFSLTFNYFYASLKKFE